MGDADRAPAVPDTKWELLDFKNISINYTDDGTEIENTLQFILRKLDH